MQRALYRIAETASSARDMPSFYGAIHEIVGELMYADNFYIALYDDRREMINFPFYRDQVDLDIPDPALWEPIGTGQAAGLTGYLLHAGEPMLMSRPEYEEIVARGEAAELGVSGTDWMGTPLQADGRTIGAVVTQSYRDDRRHTPQDLELLTFVAQHIATALTRARAIEETRQRNEELALVNEIGAALSRQLDFDAVIELVGERVRGIFKTDSIFIGIHDEAAGTIGFPYSVEAGERLPMEPIRFGDGLSSQIIRSRRPMRLGTSTESDGIGAIQVGQVSQSWLGVPILAGNRAIGVVGLESFEPNAYTEADERLLATLASSMGVALENARVFDETKRLLTEADERAAELAIINSVQSGLAQNLDMQAMYDLVGDKIREIFDAQVVDIGIIDHDDGLIHYPYTIERGVRFPDEPTRIDGSPLMLEMLRERRSLLWNDLPAWEAERGIVVPIVQGEPSLSVIIAPLMGGGKVRGRISLQNLDRTNAFTDSDLRLLSTLAGSLSVALENARLFDETKRLLTETDERAAELAIINRVQQGLAANLDMQSMYDLVGDKIQEIFDAQVVDIGIVNRDTATIRFPYTIERGVRFPDQPMEIIGLRKQVLESRQPLLINEDAGAVAIASGQPDAIQGEPAMSSLWAPLIVGEEARGVISLQNLDREHA
ncbi:MAG: GAF domain-containing protein, partial [Candidatus Limnocylindria bacterium]